MSHYHHFTVILFHLGSYSINQITFDFVFFSEISVLSLLIPILVSFLLEEKNFRTASKAARSLHEDSLQRLMKIGPQYPEQFRVIMASQSDLKSNLEAAIKLNQLTKSNASAKPSAKLNAGPAKPTITLKTDFSNFSG